MARRLAEWLTEKVIELPQARRLFPTRPSVNTLRRWSNPLRGCKSNYNGEAVVLETYKTGARMTITSEEAVHRFLDRLNGVGQ